MSDDKEALKKKVIDFVKAQPGYDVAKHERLGAFCSDLGYRVVYGEDEMIGIMGLGDTADLAYEDFVRSWHQLKGFIWIEKNR